MAMAQKHHEKLPDHPDTELVPPQYHEFLDIFAKKKSEHFLDERPYDQAINLKPDFVPKVFKQYHLSPLETTKMNEFIDENLQKDYI